MKTNYCRPIGFLILLTALCMHSPDSLAQTINIGPNQYAFRFTGNPNYGLFFNAANTRYEFRNGSATAVFGINADNGHLTNNLRFAPGFSYEVPAGTWAARSGSAPNAGIFFGATDFELRLVSGSPGWSMNAASGNSTFAGTVSAPGGNSNQWNQAHAWGNHASAGYLSAAAVDANNVPKWNGSTLVNSTITAGTNSATVSGAPTSILGVESILLVNNPGNLGFPATSEARMSFSKAGSRVAQIGTSGDDFIVRTGSNNEAMRIYSSGISKVSASPVSILGSGSIFLVDNPGGASFPNTNESRMSFSKAGIGVAQLGTAGDDFVVRTGGVESLRLNNAGQMGVGTAPVSNSTLTAVKSAAGTAGAAINATVSYVGNSDVRAVRGTAVTNPGYGIGVDGIGGYMGVRGEATATTDVGTAYGVYGSATGSTGTRIGVYGQAVGGNTNWAGYFSGNQYVSGDLRIGTTTGASGYKVSVNGKIMCTELRVLAVSGWPDYVFGESHSRLSLDELGTFVQSNKHLPGVPSAAEMEAAEGYEVGEMQKITLEKVEELTLYILEQHDRIKAQDEAALAQQAQLAKQEQEIEALKALVQTLIKN